MERITQSELKSLLMKLQTPLHIDYIATNILNKSNESTQEILNELISESLITKKSENYYEIRK
jgi:hypothetical protein